MAAFRSCAWGLAALATQASRPNSAQDRRARLWGITLHGSCWSHGNFCSATGGWPSVLRLGKDARPRAGSNRSPETARQRVGAPAHGCARVRLADRAGDGIDAASAGAAAAALPWRHCHRPGEGIRQPKFLRLRTFAPLRWFNCIVWDNSFGTTHQSPEATELGDASF